ncbi:translin-associated protein X [Venturia canescens]|uniref:translin-associated protein X n=1 Tax=Venturia canescens TaxID=32260 RepID=UPI001C9C9303|nr:translin-associated protein X [Venturia canescens]XP_043272537.1 translin-associated protein X [Venturia canescens]
MYQGRNSGGGNHRNRNYHHHHGHKNKESLEDKRRSGLEHVDPNSLVIKQFRAYAAELDDKHDRYERIVKLCRDLTIESKRIIFLLHTLDKETKREAVLGEAKSRLDVLTKTLYKNIAMELDGQDPYQYVRAYRGGLQEYVEAVTFYQYLRDKTIEDWSYLEKNLVYSIPPRKTGKKDEEVQEVETTKTIQTLVPPVEYILGIADLTGELMRKCINDLASGDINSCYNTCNFVRDVYKGFLGCAGLSVKEVNKKVYTLKQSLIKMENVCYAIKVRGSEMPKHMLADVANSFNDEYPADDDEGYQA